MTTELESDLSCHPWR